MKTLKGIRIYTKITYVLFFCCVVFLHVGCQKMANEQDIIVENVEDIEIVEFGERLLFTGDIEQFGYIGELADLFTFKEIKYKDEVYQGIDTLTLFEALAPLDEEYSLYLMADDGFMVNISSNTLEETMFAYHEEMEWCFLSDKHPVNSGIKHMSECIVVANAQTEGFNLIESGEDHFITIGQLRMEMDEIKTFSDGISVQNDIEIDVMKQRQMKSLAKIMEDRGLVIEKVLMIFTQDGDVIYEFDDVGYLEVNLGQVNYVSADLSETYRGVSGIIIDPPAASITDHYEDAIHYLDKDIPVMTLFIDGFSYGEYMALTTDQEVDYIDGIEGVQEATVRIKPVTNVGFATMITGENPAVHGVHDRSYREMNVPTIFDYCEEESMSHALIEGNVQILNINTTTFMNIDNNNNGSTDDEIFESAKMRINEGYDYLMVHFHSVDDYGHDYGSTGKETMVQIKVVDQYMEELIAMWPGKVIILADHGMHDTEFGGDHGEMRVEDLIIPYVILDGGKYEKK